MLCNNCKKNEATHFLEKNVNGKVTKLALCSECARKSDEFKYDPFSGMDLFDAFFGFPSLTGRHSGALKQSKKRCTLCASTFDDIVKAGKVGCAECYKVFRDELSGTIDRIHGAAKHIGRSPQKKQVEPEKKQDDPADDSHENEVKRLKKELSEAVKSENFERAAELRDKIRGLENA